MQGEKVTAEVGTQQLRVSGLKTLAPGTRLNDIAVDRMTQVLATVAMHGTDRKVAVFDSQFTNLILETPQQPTTAGAGMEYCKYGTVVGYADKRLLGNSPLQFDCLLFPNGIYHQHWKIMAVFPKERMIVALDSMRIGSVKDARIILGSCTTKQVTTIQQT
jgi:hypothetical protein